MLQEHPPALPSMGLQPGVAACGSVRVMRHRGSPGGTQQALELFAWAEPRAVLGALQGCVGHSLGQSSEGLRC